MKNAITTTAGIIAWLLIVPALLTTIWLLDKLTGKTFEKLLTDINT